jgi:hypothetical protein
VSSEDEQRIELGIPNCMPKGNGARRNREKWRCGSAQSRISNEVQSKCVTLAGMKRICLIAMLLCSIAQAQTLEGFIGGSNGTAVFTAGVALRNVAITDALSFGVGLSVQRARLEAGLALDFAPLGAVQINSSAEVAFRGGFRGRIAANAAFASFAGNLAWTAWSAVPSQFDMFEGFALDPLPNSTSGWRLDLGSAYRPSRFVTLRLTGKFGSSGSSVIAVVEQRLSGGTLTGGLQFSTQNAQALILVLGANLSPEDSPLTIAATLKPGLVFGGGFTLGFETRLRYELPDIEAALEAYAILEPWRSDVLPLRSGLEVSFNPGVGTVFVQMYGGSSNVGAFFWGGRVLFRVLWEDLFPTPES